MLGEITRKQIQSHGIPSFSVSEFSDMLNENMGEESNMSAPGPSNIDRGYEEEAEAARALESDFPKDDEVSQNTAYHERLAELDRDMIRLSVCTSSHGSSRAIKCYIVAR